LPNKRRHDNEKYLYCFIKKLNFIEKCILHEKIPKAQADELIKDTIEQINQIKFQIPNFSIDQFADVC